MKINFTKKEYAALLDILEISEWIMNSNKIGSSEKNDIYSMVQQKIYSYAKEMGCDELLMYDEEFKEYYPTSQFDETSPYREIIDEYDNETFWGELLERFIERDMEKHFGRNKMDRMTLDEYFDKEEPFRRKYSEEFGNNGIEHLFLREPAREVNVFRIN